MRSLLGLLAVLAAGCGAAEAPVCTALFDGETLEGWTRLGEAPYMAGADYTIADIATWPWVARWEWHGISLDDVPNVKRWFDEIGARPAVQKGVNVPPPAQ